MRNQNSDVLYECQALINRAARAYRYMMGTWDWYDQWEINEDISANSGEYTVVSIRAQEIAEEFVKVNLEIDETQSCPLELWDRVYGYAERAAERISYKYEFNFYDELREWGRDLIVDYAREDDYQWPGELGIQAMLACEMENHQ